MNKKSITILVVCLIVTVLSVSLAYYSNRIIGNGKNVSVNAKELTINFDNNNEIAEGIIEPGWSSTNTFSVENKSKSTFTYDIVLKNYKNTTKTNGYLVYKITSTNGYNMTEYKDMPKDGDNTYDLVIARGITIEPGSSNKQNYSLEIKYLDSTEDQSIDMGSTVTGSLYIVESTTNEDNPYTKGTLGYQIMEDNSNIKARTDFTKTYTDVNIGTMYKAQEDNTDVYYFAGDTRNNWVKFGTWQEDKTVIVGTKATDDFLHLQTYNSLSECTSSSSYNYNCREIKIASKGDAMYWRIVRTNKDGSIRLLYSGTSPESTSAFIDFNRYNESYTDPMYVGYMYGTSGSLENNRLNTNSSKIKSAIDSWYANNMTSYTKYLSTTAVYCNDRSITSGTYSTSSEFDYAPYTRLSTNYIPTYDCAATEDKFTVDSSTGNGKLTYPIALMTADEIVHAGIVPYLNNILNVHLFYNSNKTSATGKYQWSSMTPSVFSVGAYVWRAAIDEEANGLAARIGVRSIFPIRPVISLKKNLLYKSGDGSATNPYEIQGTPDTISERLLSDKSTRPGERTDFSTVLTTDNTKTLYTGSENDTTIYYFAGNATDNWVKFGGFYWRIIRTNADGSIRLLYHSTSTTAVNSYIGGSSYNLGTNPMYVGYMYGTSGSLESNRTNTTSNTIKNLIDTWYQNNLTSYTKYLSTTAIYCNDREVGTGTYTTKATAFTYKSNLRLAASNILPTHNCENIKDSFSVNNTSAKLTYPIALMTADEAVLAGGIFNNSNNANMKTWYYYNSANGSSTDTQSWWTMTPSTWLNAYAHVFIINGSYRPGGELLDNTNDTNYMVRPVISIKGDNLWKSGDGSASSPYEIVTD